MWSSDPNCFKTNTVCNEFKTLKEKNEYINLKHLVTNWNIFSQWSSSVNETVTESLKLGFKNYRHWVAAICHQNGATRLELTVHCVLWWIKSFWGQPRQMKASIRALNIILSHLLLLEQPQDKWLGAIVRSSHATFIKEMYFLSLNQYFWLCIHTLQKKKIPW